MSTPVAAAPVASPTDAPAPTAPAENPQIRAMKAPAPKAEAGSDGKTEPTAAQTAEKVEKAAEKRRYKLKVDGQEREEALSDEEITVRLQKAHGAEKRFQEAARAQQQVKQFLEQAKQDPRLLIKELLGQDPDDWMETQITEKWRKEMLPEQERKALEQQGEMERLRKQLAAHEHEKSQAIQKQQEDALEASMERDIRKAFEISKLEFNAEHLQEFAKVADDALQYGVVLTPEQMVAEVLGRQDTTHKKADERMFNSLKSLRGEDLLGRLGDDLVKEVLRASVAKHKAANAKPAFIATPKNESTAPAEKPKYSTTAAWRKLGRGL